MKTNTCLKSGSKKNILFLPGASGDANFWRGVGCDLPFFWNKRFLSWPGIGHQDPDPNVNSMADLYRLAESAVCEPSAVVAQSMGGIIAMQLALNHPELVTHLILTATSGGLDIARHGGTDWRPAYLHTHPHTARWITTENMDLTAELHRISTPTLLLWGGRDTISPPAVGAFLAERINDSTLQVIPEGEHAMGFLMPEKLAPLINDFLAD